MKEVDIDQRKSGEGRWSVGKLPSIKYGIRRIARKGRGTINAPENVRSIDPSRIVGSVFVFAFVFFHWRRDEKIGYPRIVRRNRRRGSQGLPVEPNRGSFPEPVRLSKRESTRTNPGFKRRERGPLRDEPSDRSALKHAQTPTNGPEAHPNSGMNGRGLRLRLRKLPESRQSVKPNVPTTQCHPAAPATQYPTVSVRHAGSTNCSPKGSLRKLSFFPSGSENSAVSPLPVGSRAWCRRMTRGLGQARRAGFLTAGFFRNRAGSSRDG